MPGDNREEQPCQVVPHLSLLCYVNYCCSCCHPSQLSPLTLGSIPFPYLFSLLGSYQFSDRPSYSHFPSLSAVFFLQYQAITTPYVEEF